MGKQYVSKHIYFTETHINIMDELIEKNPSIKNYSEAVRYALLNLNDDSMNNNKELQRKIKAMSKSIDILTEMVAGGFHANEVMAIGKAEETYIYTDAKKNVENKIQRNTTIQSNMSNLTKTKSRNFI
ncbi:hypothetical protein [Heyndrickxia sporothermodurans]|uniref:hypothetical protein n=1 Tax=Heyndrickxia sporothermodurans TaxID=46224 RepID=UPI0035D882B5